MPYHCDADHALEDAILSTTSSLSQLSFKSGSLNPSEDVSEFMMAHIQSNSDVLESCQLEHDRQDNDTTMVQKSEAQSGHSASLNVTQKDQNFVVSTRREKLAPTVVRLLTLWSDKDLLLLVSPSPSPAPAVKRIMIRREKTGTDWQSVFDVVKYDEEKRAVVVIEERVVV
ncbi:hypothetical protein EV424DRAFT_1536481 [Suillus variegatus]|nr:hypothetical protein EV424DRAFT_1536481 [Suillus variegatus]